MWQSNLFVLSYSGYHCMKFNGMLAMFFSFYPTCFPCTIFSTLNLTIAFWLFLVTKKKTLHHIVKFTIYSIPFSYTFLALWPWLWSLLSNLDHKLDCFHPILVGFGSGKWFWHHIIVRIAMAGERLCTCRKECDKYDLIAAAEYF